MATLNPKPGSSSKAQHRTLILAARSQGIDTSELRSLVGGSIRKLSVATCSDWIKRFGGGDLANPPGQKPGPYTGKRSAGNVRMISADQIDQITRLAREYFDGQDPADSDWLLKNFKVADPRQLATAKRAGEVIAVLKGMHQRKRNAEG